MKKITLFLCFALFSTTMLLAQSPDLQQNTETQTLEKGTSELSDNKVITPVMKSKRIDEYVAKCKVAQEKRDNLPEAVNRELENSRKVYAAQALSTKAPTPSKKKTKTKLN